MGLGVNRRYAFLMKPGCGPTMKGLLVKTTRSEFVLLDAVMVTDDADQKLSSPVVIERGNVYCRQELR